jgi:putative MATE family efflux protein
MTVGEEWKAIFLFSLPIMASEFLQVFYHLADSVIVGQVIGPSALGAIGLVSSAIWMLVSFCVGIGSGTSVLISQLYGARRHEDTQISISGAYMLAILVSILLTVASCAFSRSLIVGFLRAPAEMRDDSILYFRVYALGLIFQALYNVTYGILRAIGDSRSGMYFLLCATVLNVFLDLIFIIFFRWGVMGAAVATVLSQGLCAIVSIGYLIRFNPTLVPRFSMGRSEREKIKTIFGISAPIILQSIVLSVGFTVLQRLVNFFGTPSVEGYSSMCRIEELAHIPSKSFNAAVCTFTGQNIGAGLPNRARKGYRSSLFIGLAFTAVIAICVIAVSSSLLGAFNVSGESLRRGREHLILLMIFMGFSMTSNITSGFLQGAGDVRFPSAASFLNLSVRLVTAYLMSRTFIDFRSVYLSMPPAWIITCLVLVRRYRGGKWQRAKLA